MDLSKTGGVLVVDSIVERDDTSDSVCDGRTNSADCQAFELKAVTATVCWVVTMLAVNRRAELLSFDTKTGMLVSKC
jgi:hypothetical protein